MVGVILNPFLILDGESHQVAVEMKYWLEVVEFARVYAALILARFPMTLGMKKRRGTQRRVEMRVL